MKAVALLSRILAKLDGTESIPNPPLGEDTPVVVVHGIFSDSGDMTRLVQYLRAEGFHVLSPDLSPSNGSGGIEELARQLAAYIDQYLPNRRINLVGFSMGGIVSSYYTNKIAPGRVSRLITIAAPHKGTLVGWLHPSKAAKDLRPKSAILQQLEEESRTNSPIRETTIYTPFDLLIVPYTSSILAGAENIRVWAMIHPGLILKRRCIEKVAETLRKQ